ncbi:MAG: cobalamin B12-binding domain-containing protein [Nitrospirae bacterium]|nr:cobalamin B12-binding domain-containing protein [Nitrospirota bacterium]
MKVLLINPPLYGTGSEPRFPLGLGYIASVLREDGHKVQVVDANALKLPEARIEELINAVKFDAVGMTGLITQFKQVQRTASIIKNNSGAAVVLGGGLASAAPEVVLKKTAVDVVVLGEGEETASELFKALENGAALQEVKGLCFKRDGGFFKTAPREPLENISSLPMPAWDLFPVRHYFNNNVMCMPKRRMSMLTSRGCPYHCAFCFHGVFGHRHRARTAENIFKEIALLHEKYGVTGFVFEDDTFVLDKKRVYGLCGLITDSRLKLRWTCNARINLVDADLLAKMKKAGCVEISYGIESGNQKQLEKIKKGITVEQAYKVVDMTRKAGIITHGFVMLGLPGETAATIKDSVSFCKRAGIPAEFTIMTPIPGSRIYQDAVAANMMKRSVEDLVENWGSWLDKVLVNLTELPDEKLLEMKRAAELEIFSSYYKRHPGTIIKMLFLELKTNGFFAFFHRLKKGAKLLIRSLKGLGLRERPTT